MCLVEFGFAVAPNLHLLSHHWGDGRSDSLALPFLLSEFPFKFTLAVNFPAIVVQVAFDGCLHGVGNKSKAIFDTFRTPLEVSSRLVRLDFFNLITILFVGFPFVLPLLVVGDFKVAACFAFSRNFKKSPLGSGDP